MQHIFFFNFMWSLQKYTYISNLNYIHWLLTKKINDFQNCSFLSYSRELYLNEYSMLLHDEHELETYKRKAAWLPISLTKKLVNLNLKKSIIFPHFSYLNVSVENKNNYLHDLWLLYHLKVFFAKMSFFRCLPWRNLNGFWSWHWEKTIA